MAEEAREPDEEYFDLYYLPLDSKVQIVWVYDQYREECIMGLNKSGKKLIVSAPLNVWQDVFAQIKAKAGISGGRFTFYDDRFGLNVACKPDLHSRNTFECVTFSQPISRMGAAIGSVFQHRPGYLETAIHQVTISAACYDRLSDDMDFGVKLFKVWRI